VPSSPVSVSVVRGALASALDLLLPAWCAGCDEPGVTLCAGCRSSLEAPSLARALGDGVDVRSAVAFDGPAARVMRALKEDGRTGLARPLGRLIRPLLPADAVVVPVPSSRAAMRRRGYSVTELLVRRAGVTPARLLRTAPGARADQRELGRSERERNVAGMFRARPCAGERVVVVDDVVTTGATLREAVRTLRDAGGTVVGAVTVAATAQRGIVTALTRDIRPPRGYGGGHQGELRVRP